MVRKKMAKILGQHVESCCSFTPDIYLNQSRSGTGGNAIEIVCERCGSEVCLFVGNRRETAYVGNLFELWNYARVNKVGPISVRVNLDHVLATTEANGPPTRGYIWVKAKTALKRLKPVGENDER